jgi:hypothetical protein
MGIRRIGIEAACRAALVGLALASPAHPASAELVLAINNRTCAVLTVHLPGASDCGPAAPGCFVAARNGFTTKIAVDQAYNDGFVRLTAQGECAGRNVKLAGECVIGIKRVTERVRTPGGALYELDTYVQVPATLVAVEITQGICDNQDGVRHCELTCRARDQQ